MVDFGCKLKNLRKQLNLTQEQLAKRLNITKSMVSAYETSMRMPSYEVLIKIALLFNVSTDYLLGIEKRSTTKMLTLSDSQKQALLNVINEFENYI